MEKNFNTIFEGLNEEQKLAVSTIKGPLLIVAGAGSGKTRVLTSRIAYILENDCPPERILSLTFTKKAASEMKERIASMVGKNNARRLVMGTFHAVFIKFLKEYATLLGYPEQFTIYDTSNSISLIKTCLKEMKLEGDNYKPKSILSRISMAKNNLCTAEAYMSNSQAIDKDAKAKMPRLCEVFLNYSNKCKQAGVMDFDDILLNMNLLIKNNPAVLEAIASRFDYIMVDEYQDTNFSQYLILRNLSKFHNNICVVGDDSQSIYAFRGAKIENILNFKKDYPTSKTFKLETNYRSTRVIVDAANSVIAKNSSRIPKNCHSAGEEGNKIKIISAYTEQEEALLISSSIFTNAMANHNTYKDFAVLYRTNAQARAIEDALRRKNIPYIIYSGNSFFETVEIKDMMAYMKLVCNPLDDEAFKRIVNTPARGIGNTSILALKNAAIANNSSLFNAISLGNLAEYGLKNAAISKLRSFADMINDKISRYETADAHKIVTAIAMDSGLYMFYKADSSIESQTRAANIEELLNGVKLFIEEKNNEYFEELQVEDESLDIENVNFEDFPLVKLNEYIENISLLSAADQGGDDEDKVTLMTVHSSKGLEYPYVYIAGMEENIFPSGGFFATESDIEEERRLFYVAVTRAKKEVCLSFANSRMRNGRHESNNSSRFLSEIDPQYLLNPNVLGNVTTKSSTSVNRSGWTSSTPVSSKNRTISDIKRSMPADRVEQRSSYSQKGSLPSMGRVVPLGSSTPVTIKAADPNFVQSSIIDIKVGSRVEHNKFGYGDVLEISGPPNALKSKIKFDQYGEKIILLAYAKLRLIDSE